MIIAAIENERKTTDAYQAPPGPAVSVEPREYIKPEVERRGGFSMNPSNGMGGSFMGPSKANGLGPDLHGGMYPNSPSASAPPGSIGDMNRMVPMDYSVNQPISHGGTPGRMPGGSPIPGSMHNMHPGNAGNVGMGMRMPGPYGGGIPGMGMNNTGIHGGTGMSGGHLSGDPRMPYEREMWNVRNEDGAPIVVQQTQDPKTEGSDKAETSSGSLSPSGDRKKLSRKEFRETIGVQLYQDLVSGEFSYDEVIAKYKRLYPEYESKFTRNFCSKTRCGRIMTASTSEPKRNVKGGDPKIQRITKKSPRKPWTRMTKDLVCVPALYY
jgi:hypothetical protein